MDTADLLTALAGWGLDVRTVERMPGGLNSSVWVVRSSGRRYVAKLADARDSVGFRSGLRVARRAADRGFSSGAPVPRPDGALFVPTSAGDLALLEYVEGRPVDGAARVDQQRMGAALARAHATLAEELDCLDRRLVWPWPWADAALATTPMSAQVRGAARRVLDDLRELVAAASLPVQVIHGDPAPDAFVLHDSSPDRDGVVDWSATMGAPRLYDLATVSADDPSRSPALLDGYVAVAPEVSRQLRHLNAFTRLRWMCVAVYMADRIARGIVRGGSREHNDRVLTRAYAGMRS